jgi:hypothetical protein
LNKITDYPQLQISQLYQVVENIEGWLTYVEQTALLHLPTLVDHLDGEIIEIGSYKGKSTTALALGSKWISKRKRPIYAIDPFIPNGEYQDQYFNDFQQNILRSQIVNYVIPIREYSQEAIHVCPMRIAALFVDGNQSYTNINKDIELYAPRIVKGGMIAFHDYTIYQDVKRAVNELCDRKEFVLVCDYDSLRLIRKIKQI